MIKYENAQFRNRGLGFMEENEELTKKSNKKHYGLGCFLVVVVVLSLMLAGIIRFILRSIGSDIEEPEIKKKIDSCEEYNIKEIAIQNFKDSDYFYNYIDSDSISNIVLRRPKTIFSDSKNNVYTCSGLVEVFAEKDGFLPSENNDDNPYYKKIHHIEEEPYYKEYLDKYTSYKCTIEYTSKINNGTVVVSSTYCGKDADESSFESPEFVCEGICEPTIIKDETPEEEKPQFESFDYEHEEPTEKLIEQKNEEEPQNVQQPAQEIPENSVEESLKTINIQEPESQRNEEAEETEEELDFSPYTSDDKKAISFR